jgi:hypothetical protein
MLEEQEGVEEGLLFGRSSFAVAKFEVHSYFGGLLKKKVAVDRTLQVELIEAQEFDCFTGDRPIEITVERVWSALDWRARLQLMRQLLTGLAAPMPDINGTQLKALESDDAVEMMTQQLTAAFPQVTSPPSRRSTHLEFQVPR